MCGNGEVKDILVLAFLRDGLAMRNSDLIKQQQKVAMTLLARRKDIIARKRAYRMFIMLERAISSDYHDSTVPYYQSIHQGKIYLKENETAVEYGKKHPRISRRVFDYLKSRFSRVRQ